jgi:hypothetical protein
MSDAYVPEEEMVSPQVAKLTRFAAQLLQASYEKVVIGFKGSSGEAQFDEPLFYRVGIPETQPSKVDEVAELIEFSAEEISSILSDTAQRVLNNRFSYWSDMNGAYGIVSFHPADMGVYVKIYRLVPKGDEANVTRTSLEALYPKARRVATAQD